MLIATNYPRDPRNQLIIATTTNPDSFASINARLRALTEAHNNIPGTGPWMYVGRDVPFLAGFSAIHVPQYCLPRFRRVGYDMIEIEGVIRVPTGGD